jgi:hypothetical protein
MPIKVTGKFTGASSTAPGNRWLRLPQDELSDESRSRRVGRLAASLRQAATQFLASSSWSKPYTLTSPGVTHANIW